jgi:hypothetical protein
MDPIMYGYELAERITEPADFTFVGFDSKLYIIRWEDVMQKTSVYVHRFRDDHVFIRRDVFSPEVFQKQYTKHPDYERICEAIWTKGMFSLKDFPVTSEMFFMYSLVDEKPRHVITANLKQAGEELGLEGQVDLGNMKNASRLDVEHHHLDIASLMDHHVARVMRRDANTNPIVLRHRGMNMIRKFLPEALEEL